MLAAVRGGLSPVLSCPAILLGSVHPVPDVRVAMQTLRTSRIVAHVHDELIIECPPEVSLQAVSEQMGRMPPWAPGLVLRADGDEMTYYQKA